MRRLIMRLEKRLVRGYEFISNFHYYYFERRNSFRDAVELARLTIY